jgi:hypothetical protein
MLLLFTIPQMKYPRRQRRYVNSRSTAQIFAGFLHRMKFCFVNNKNLQTQMAKIHAKRFHPTHNCGGQKSKRRQLSGLYLNRREKRQILDEHDKV